MLALDFGAARIGVAVSDELGLMAHPRPYISARPRSMALRLIDKCVRLEGIGRVMVGLPRNMNGSEGLSARHARQFAKELSDHLGLPVELVDERWSTVEARARLDEAGRNERESKTRIDSASAAVLLQSVLDAEKSRR